jgi:hypothetical protein
MTVLDQPLVVVVAKKAIDLFVKTHASSLEHWQADLERSSFLGAKGD